MPRPLKGAQPERRRPPATTPKDQENHMISIAMEVAERQLLEGKASSQVITHFLKLGSVTEQLQRDKLILEQELLKARAENITSSAKSEELLKQAIKAFSTYRGDDPEEEVFD